MFIPKDFAVFRIMKEEKESKRTAEVMYNQLNNVHPDLEPCIKSWLNKKNENFTFNGISLFEIMEKSNSTYLDAIFQMSVLLKNPELIDHFRKMTFSRE